MRELTKALLQAYADLNERAANEKNFSDNVKEDFNTGEINAQNVVELEVS